MLDSSTYSYHPSFCEENVYWLCDRVAAERAEEGGEWFAVFVSNPSQQVRRNHTVGVTGAVYWGERFHWLSSQVHLWKQRAGLAEEDGLVCWDYHVLALHLLAAPEAETLVWDLDRQVSLVPTLCQASFPPHTVISPMRG